MIEHSRNFEDETSRKAFEKSHQLVLEIFNHVPSLLLNVVPQLEEELKVEDVDIRFIAISTLGEMWATRGVKWVETYPNVWKGWCERFLIPNFRRNDKSLLIRNTWNEYVGKILKADSGMCHHLESLIKIKLLDPEEKIRISALKAIGLAALEHPTMFSDELLREVSVRCKDKKVIKN